MGFTLRFRGISISCGTAEEVDALVQLYGLDVGSTSVARSSEAQVGEARSFSRSQILTAIEQKGGPLRTAQICDAVGAVGSVERGRVSSQIFKLSKEGALEKIEHGVYRLPVGRRHSEEEDSTGEANGRKARTKS